MSIGVSHFKGLTVLLDYGSPRTKDNFCNCNSVSWQVRKRNPRSSALQLVALASASSVSGSGAEYSEGLLDGLKKRKRKRTAGIDQDELVDPEHMADPDSRFSEFNGVRIHHKIYDAVSSIDDSDKNNNDITFQDTIGNVPLILLHGLGASVFSWNRAMKRLAAVSGSKVLAFDRPAFGLTSRVASSCVKKMQNL